MTATERAAPRLRAAYPQLFVADVRRSIAFFEARLGFREAYAYGEPPFYALVERDGAGLNLRQVDAPPIEEGLRDREVLLGANIVADDIEALYREFQARDVDFAQALQRQPWGTTDFIVRDPDGNLICFASVVDAG